MKIITLNTFSCEKSTKQIIVTKFFLRQSNCVFGFFSFVSFFLGKWPEVVSAHESNANSGAMHTQKTICTDHHHRFVSYQTTKRTCVCVCVLCEDRKKNGKKWNEEGGHEMNGMPKCNGMLNCRAQHSHHTHAPFVWNAQMCIGP